MHLCTVCKQQKNTFCQFRLPSNHQICDLGSSSYQAWCAKSETTQFFGNQSYMMKVCPHIRIGICLSEILCAYADIWANFGLIWPIPKKSGTFGLGTSCLITWDSQVTCLIKYSQSLPTYPHRVSENHLLLKSQFLPDTTNRDARFWIFWRKICEFFIETIRSWGGAREMDFFDGSENHILADFDVKNFVISKIYFPVNYLWSIP